MKPTNRFPALCLLLAACGGPNPDPGSGTELPIDAAGVGLLDDATVLLAFEAP